MSTRLVMLLALIGTVVVPAGASAATLAVDGDLAVYQAARGEHNHLVGGSNFDEGNPFLELRETGAPVALGAGCSGGDPIVCLTLDGGFPSPRVLLGDLSDYASVNTFVGTTAVYGEGGDDDVLAGASGTALASGGPGDDRVVGVGDTLVITEGGPGDDWLSNNGPAHEMYGGPGDDTLLGGCCIGRVIDGGAGADRIRVTGLDQDQLVTGGPGSDTIAVDKAVAQVLGDGGDDAIIMFGANPGELVSGGAGADVIGYDPAGVEPDCCTAGATILAGGPGSDLISGTPWPDGLSGGDGADRVDAYGGGADTVRCGSGYDVVWADPEDRVAADCEERRAVAPPAFPALASARRRAAAIS